MNDAQPMNRRERFVEVLRLEGLAAAAKARANTLRDALEAEACAEHERDGTAPTWRVADLGTVTLPVSKESVVVADHAALLRWCKERHPEQVHTVEEVYASFQGALLATCVIVGDVAALPDTGEVVPGLAVRPGGQPGSLTLRPGTGVRRWFQQLGEAALRHLDVGEQWLDGGER